VISLELKVNPKYKALMPELLYDEYEKLKESISKNGYWEEYPIIVNDNYEILDGHSRWEACQELGVQPTIKVKHFESKEEEMRFVIETNLNRRHLNAFQKAELALKLLEIEKAKAEKRKLAQLKQFKDKTTVPALEEGTGEAIEIVAGKLKMSPYTIRKTKEILEKGKEKLIEKCRRGEISVNEAYKRVREIKVNVVRAKDLIGGTLIEYFKTQDLDTLYRLKENLAATHRFLDEVLSKGLLDRKGLELYKKKIETFGDLLGQIISMEWLVIREKKGE
jgi:ParB-like chromosome segregation protein Spo0J